MEIVDGFKSVVIEKVKNNILIKQYDEHRDEEIELKFPDYMARTIAFKIIKESTKVQE